MNLQCFEDSKKIGMIMMFFSTMTYTLGVIRFFEHTLIIIANLCFLAGMWMFVGVSGSIQFFKKKGKRRGSVLYFIGLALILCYFTLIGSILQLIGLFLIFRAFLPDIYYAITRMPHIGQYLKSYWLQNFLDSLSPHTSSRI